jgi:hypothetical protein
MKNCSVDFQIIKGAEYVLNKRVRSAVFPIKIGAMVVFQIDRLR